MEVIRFSLLGPVAVRAGGQEIRMAGAKSRALLAALLFRANRTVSLSSLHSALWGPEPPVTATASLHNHLGRLRRALGTEGAARLSSTPYGLMLQVADGELDLQEFTALLALTRSARTGRDWQTVSRNSRAAMTLWRGQPLSDLPELHGLKSDVRHLKEARLQALEWHFEAELHLGRHAEVTPELNRWTARHPLHEALHVQLVTALYRSGRQAEALTAYETVRAALAEELGVDPGPALRTVHQQVLTADPALLDVPAATPALVLANLPDAADVTSAATSAAATRAPAQLPTDITRFTGRQDELRRLRQILEQTANSGGPGVVTVTGMGGVGKSALAVHAAHLLRDRFPDGQLYLDLRGFGPGSERRPHEVLATFLAHLQEPAPSTPPFPEHTDDRAALLRTLLAERRVLLVLDNARDSAQVLPLLPGTGASAAIVTSRNTLTDLPTVHHLPLTPMDVEEQRALLSALAGSDRVTQDLDGALRILAACAGLPLALRIVGARLAARPAWPLATLADRLGDGGPGRLEVLTTGQLGVRATFDASYLALRDSGSESGETTESDQGREREAARAFRLLGLCQAQVFTPASAAALLDRTPDDAAELLERLVDAHLLQTPAPLRYCFHDLLGEYAAERAHTDETAHAREEALLRLGTWYALALENVRDAMRDCAQMPPRLDQAPPAPLPVFTDGAEALAWCREELPNIGEAIRQAGEGPRPDIAWRLAVWLFGYMRTFWWTGQWEDYLNRALRITEQHEDRLGRTWVLRTLGACHGMARRLDKSIQALQEALELTGFESPESTAVLQADLSIAYGGRGQTEQALTHVRAAHDHPRRDGHPQQAAFFVSSMADALREAGQHTEAEARYREALALWRRRGDANSTGITLSNLGDVLRALGRREEAFAALQESIDIFERIGNVACLADSLVIMARAHVQLAEWPQARARLRQAVDLADRHRLDPWLSEAREILDSIESAHLWEA